MTLRHFTAKTPDVSMSTAWSLADLGEAKGRQDLFARQLPQRLKAMREHALIESAVSSNRIEGVEIDASRVRAVVLGKPALPSKSEVVTDAIRRTVGDFSIAELQRECPGVSVDMLRHVLKRLRKEGEVDCLGRGRTARWRS